ncbi:Piezo-type mechanosensitive ion channel [Sesamum angolense]|uniref:Piezo-type mechanosensitive ion channel n=1 Tax=Sesamum angolense TaxID=2727404 RepID=A0AAE1X8A9_9LAMI|nr:Piezo-type mechanosensitive ion channel [Sesamum angolense]
MRSILSGLLLPLLLLTAGLVNWSLISLINLLTSLLFRFTAPKKEFRFRRRNLSLWFVFIYSSFVILLQVLFLSICASLDPQWSIADAWWIKLLGLIKGPSWTSPRVIYFLVIELLVVLIALTEIKKDKFGFVEFQGSFWRSEDSFWVYLSSIAKHIGYRLRLASCLLLPAVQLVSGISNPSWLSLPFFVCSCVGLVDWSLTSNFLGLFRWWKLLWAYAGFSICLLYVYQLPVGFPHSFQAISNSIGLYKVSVDSDWQQICSGTSLMVFYYMLSCVKHDLEDMEFIMSLREGNLTEQLLPSRSSFFVHQLRSGVRHTNILLRGPVFRIFSINWFTYGFPISLFALSYWSFHFASICAFGLLAYVGYILYAFPSLFRLHRLNGLLLVFILLWAVSTYVFNVAFAYTKLKAGKDMEIWEMVGLWHYPIPGFFLLAQFCLGILVALGNLVNNSVFLCLSNEERRLSSENETEEVKEDAKVLVVATIAWGLRKCSRAIMLLLIFLIATKPGFIHAAYMIFFFAYLLSHKVNKRMRQSLILLCEAHFAILYILQLNLVSRKLEQKGSTSLDVLSQLGLVVDDPRMLISYYVVFMLTCFKLRADHASGFSWSFTYEQMVSQRKNAFVWRDLSFETKSMWTFLDYLRVYCYCHLLDLVLALILITGTLEYDVLHFGYLGFALIFFRMRLTILKKKNKIFKYLRIYNFAVIVLSLAYQSPFFGDFSSGKCETVDYIYEVIGFYKYDYGFRITSRSVLVEMIIFVLVSCQSYMFSSSEFNYVFRYLEAEQIGAIVQEQEKKAAWKTEQLQHIRKSEENKSQRNLQVEKMKSEMLNLQIQLHGMNSTTAYGNESPTNGGVRRRRNASLTMQDFGNFEKRDGCIDPDQGFSLNMNEYPSSVRGESPLAADYTKHLMEASFSEIAELEEHAGDNAVNDSDKSKKGKSQSIENSLASAVQLLGDGVSQVQSIGNQAVSDLVSFLNIASEDSDSNEPSSSEALNDRGSTDIKHKNINRSSSVQSEKSRTSDSASLQIGRIFCYIWSQMRSNNDVVCYCCFIIVFLWNFSLLSMVYLAALFLYALCVNTGPNYVFWIVMLIYTEFNVLIQYLYQIMIQHCGFSIQSGLLRELGFPTERITSSFVISLLPLFLVYLFTLIQCSITAKDGEWYSVGFNNCKGGFMNCKELQSGSSWSEKAKKVFNLMEQMVEMVVCSCSKHWKSLTQEAESPPYFVQLSMDVKLWPKDGIQPERIESGINQLLQLVHDENCKNEKPNNCPCASKVQIQSIEKNSENANVALVVFEVVYASPSAECEPAEQYNSLTPAADVAKEILKARSMGLAEKIGFPYPIVSVIGGGKREIDLYAYVFGADLAVFFLVAIFYQSVIKNKSEFLEYYQLEDQFPKEFVFILMMYSSGNPTNIANPINDASFQLDIKTAGGRLTLYYTTLCERLAWDQVDSSVDLDPQHYLDSYNVNDIQLICCQTDASTLWLVPNAVQKQFTMSLSDMEIKFSWVLTRDRPKGKETVKFERSVDPLDLPNSSEVEGVLNGSFSSFRTFNIYPRFFRVTGSGEVRPFVMEVNDVSADLVLHHGSSKWWSFHDINSLDAYGCRGLSGPMAVIVSEETPQGFLGETLSKFSIWGLYITFVLAVGRFIRLQCSDLRMRIPYENLPLCDRLIAICEDIYAARAEGELGVEEVLYWTLVKIYRSPHMLLEYTNPD